MQGTVIVNLMMRRS